MALYRVNLTLDFSLKMTLKCVIIFNLDFSTVLLINLDNMMLLNNCTHINCNQLKNTKIQDDNTNIYFRVLNHFYSNIMNSLPIL